MKNKGGTPTVAKRETDKKLQELGLFNRDAPAYLSIEKELDALTPAKAFDVFTHYCARRGGKDQCTIVKNQPTKKNAIIRQYKRSMETFAKEANISGSLEPMYQLIDLSEPIFAGYIKYIFYDYCRSISLDNEETNSFSFTTETSFKWGFLAKYYPEEKQQKINEYLFKSYIKNDSEVAVIYENSNDKASVKKLCIDRICSEESISMSDVTNNLESLFYLEDRKKLNFSLYPFRSRKYKYAVAEKESKNAAQSKSDLPTIQFDIVIDKPIEYLQEMIENLRNDWINNNKLLGLPEEKVARVDIEEQRKLVMGHEPKQKSLAGKLTDILYIHDCKRFSFTNTWITDNITHYYIKKRTRGKDKEHFSSSGFYNYQKQGTTMIDKSYYKYY